METWLLAVLPLAGVVIGAALQFWISRTTERDKQIDSLRSQAYVDYLRAVAASAHLRSDEDLRDADRDAADAKSRIAVYGSAPVINALARFEEAGAIIRPGPPSRAFVALVMSMRCTAQVVAERELEVVLLGTAQLHAAADEPRPKQPREQARRGAPAYLMAG
jgi:hypothetical protein